MAVTDNVLASLVSAEFVTKRPSVNKRNFISKAAEETIKITKTKIKDPKLVWMFENCFPNTLDTIVEFYVQNGKPDNLVITGEIHAIWMCDSTAQVCLYLPLANEDNELKSLLAGDINHQIESVLLDRYANA